MMTLMVMRTIMMYDVDVDDANNNVDDVDVVGGCDDVRRLL